MSDLTQLFAKDPLLLTRAEVEEIVKGLRAGRHQFNAGNMRAGSTKPKSSKQKEAEAIASKLSLSLGDLGL